MDGDGRRRVVITGLGMVSPLGNDVDSSWQGLLAGKSGAAEITAFDHTDYNVHFACELKDFDPTNWIDRKTARRMDRFAQIILAAALQAREDSGFDQGCPECRCVFRSDLSLIGSGKTVDRMNGMVSDDELVSRVGVLPEHFP